MNYLKKYFLVIVIFISAALALLRFNSLQIGTSYDDAHYIILAESLSGGQGYALINFPRLQPERSFPPGFPLLLSPLTFLFPHNYSVLKLFSLLLWLASIVLIYKFFSKRLGSPYLEILTGLVALNPLLVGISVTVMSESAYLFFSLAALYLFDRWESAPDKTQTWLIVLISTLILYTQLIRTIGVSLGMAFVLYLLVKRRVRELGIFIGILLIGILMQAWLTGSLISTGYQSQVFSSSMLEKMGQVWSNVIGYSNEVLSGSLIPIFGSRLDSVLENYGLGFIAFIFNIAILFMSVWGMFTIKPKLEWMHIYFLIYVLGMLAFWNPNVGSVKARFLIPILPFLYFYFLNGYIFFKQKFSQGDERFAARSSLAILILFSIPLLVRNIQDIQNPVMNQTTDLSIGASWVAEHAAEDSIVMVNEPVPAYPHVQRKTIAFPKNGQDLLKYLDNQEIDYIIIAPELQSPRSADLDPFITNQILPVVNAASDQFILVYENSEQHVRVYQYKGEN